MPSAKSISGATATNVVATAVAGTTMWGFTVNPVNTTATTISFFDNATTSTGTLIASQTFTGAANADTLTFSFPTPIKVANGITALVATTATGDITVWVS